MNDKWFSGYLLAVRILGWLMVSVAGLFSLTLALMPSSWLTAAGSRVSFAVLVLITTAVGVVGWFAGR
jgi:hypothetical protein